MWSRFYDKWSLVVSSCPVVTQQQQEAPCAAPLHQQRLTEMSSSWHGEKSPNLSSTPPPPHPLSPAQQTPRWKAHIPAVRYPRELITAGMKWCFLCRARWMESSSEPVDSSDSALCRCAGAGHQLCCAQCKGQDEHFPHPYSDTPRLLQRHWLD